ncbi:AtpZ/AtpI family protein [Bradymonas sediminis]|uniref:F0F1 ATP synthase subunit n=1 Tax=Bradymonas sediminis TaxID=1548548 RepID=A0A2Z4FKM9_9DELT|nr:AtpZ/AtpI family protein [Bradymonas sediminis]AWV89268.1 F0F1 ATP synthase subunit [Bradymonas sediminis]TDP73439.1 ATP synthase protein I [Bradymonas sediminis]
MSDTPQKQPDPGRPALANRIDRKAKRKLDARRKGKTSVWFGLGMMGLIGWSVTVPTLLGAALGIWLDERDPSGRSWTLALLTTGLVIGCLNAWHWLNRESNEINEDSEDSDE